MPNQEPQKDLDIVIPVHSHKSASFLGALGETFHQHGIEISYIPQNPGIAQTCRQVLPDDQVQTDYLSHNPDSDFETLLEKYGIDSARKLVFPQMVYDYEYDTPSYRSYIFSQSGGPDYKPYLERLHKTLDYLDEHYERNNGGIPLQYQGAEVLRRTLQRVADYHGFTSIRIGFSPVPGKMSIRSSERMDWGTFDDLSYDQLTDQERGRAREYCQSVLNEKPQVGAGGDGESLLDNLKRKARRIEEYGFDIAPIALDWFRRNHVKRLVARISEREYMGLERSRQFIENEKYVFYPLQYFRESRVTMRSPAFYNQAWFVELLSRSLPSGYELVVKDHPQQLGAHRYSQVRTFSRYAMAVSPHLSGHDVIEHADAVVCLNNTVGYEALLWGKPVVTLGDAFYSGHDYTIDVNDLNNLDEYLHRAVTSWELTEEETIEFVSGILRGSYAGTWLDESDENIDALSNSILEFLHGGPK